MSENSESSMPAILVALIAVVIALLAAFVSNAFNFFKILFDDDKIQKKVENVTNEDSEKLIQLEKLGNGDKKVIKKKQQEKAAKFSHAWLATTLKSHIGNITGLSFSSNGKYLATSGDDRSCYVWVMKDCLHNNPKSVRINIEFDYASKISFSPDNKAFLVSMQQESLVRVYKLNKKENGALGKITPSLDFPIGVKQNVLMLQIASDGSFIAVCLEDITIIFDIKGSQLATIDTPELKHSCIDPLAKLFAFSGFTSQVSVWEVKFKKGEFIGVSKAYFIGDHRASVLSFAFSGDSKRLVTLSNDRTWKLWDVDIDYVKGQEPKLIKTWSSESIINMDTSSPVHMAFSTNGLSVSIARGERLLMYNVNREEPEEINDLMIGETKGLVYSPDDDYVVVAGNRTLLVLHNVQGLKALVDDLDEKQKHTKTKLMQERMIEMIKSTRARVESFSK